MPMSSSGLWWADDDDDDDYALNHFFCKLFQTFQVAQRAMERAMLGFLFGIESQTR
jgi:hypothetical protein